MFQENPFSGACTYATYEVVTMLLGTLVLGLILGYLIWGWLRRRVALLEARATKLRRVSQLRHVQVTTLTTRLSTVQARLEHAEAKMSLAEYKLRKAMEEIEALRDQRNTGPQSLSEKSEKLHSQEEAGIPDKTSYVSMTDEPTLADISSAMERGDISSRTPDMLRDESSQGGIQSRMISDESLENAKRIFEHTVQVDDLTLIMGIDQKMEVALQQAGILSWVHLAQSRLDDLRRIIEDNDLSLRDYDPKTWAIQARMAARGEWKKLKAYQETFSNPD